MPPFTLIHADIIDALRDIPDATFDTIVADAPYGLSITKSRSVANWDSSAIAFDAELWSELRRVTKPGGILAAFGHPLQTYASAHLVRVVDADASSTDRAAS